ncbi:MAG TPA: GrpB family protein [Papillibacter sp.]|nr:GrpB family protein [Papillibacter sp.]
MLANIAFRDYLNCHPDHAKQHCDLKLRFAEQYPQDRYAYTEARTDFIKMILRLANFADA